MSHTSREAAFNMRDRYTAFIKTERTMNLNNDEVLILRTVLQELVLKNRTGEIGIIHGENRFVSTQLISKKDGVKHLNNAFKKLGISNGIKNI